VLFYSGFSMASADWEGRRGCVFCWEFVNGGHWEDNGPSDESVGIVIEFVVISWGVSKVYKLWVRDM
jgi:hypothetical protein